MTARLHIVPPSPAPATEKVRQRIKSATPPIMLECRCGCRELVEVKVGVLFKNGRPSGGTKQLLCAACLIKGERVVIW